MPLPPVRVDLMVDGVWSNITSSVLARDGVSISRGRGAEDARTSPSSCGLTVQNGDGKYSPRNPLSPLYGKIGRNTPVRVGVGAPPVAATSFTLNEDGSDPPIGAPSVTAETSGTLFCVWGVTFPVPTFAGPAGFTMGTQRDGQVTSWAAGSKAVTAGATGTNYATPNDDYNQGIGLSVVVPGSISSAGFSGLADNRGYIDIAVTGVAAGQYLLVAQGQNVSTWGDPMVTAPAVDGITAPDWVALADSGASEDLRVRAWICRVPAGTPSTVMVRFARMDPLGVPVEAAMGDNYGRVWRLTGATDYYPRLVGEVAAWPQRWEVAADARSPITVAGVLRRLGQGAPPLRSALVRHVLSSRDVVAYWPLEDAAGAATFSSPIPGVAPGEFRGTPVLAGDEAFLGSEPLPTFQAAGFAGAVPTYGSTGQLFAGALYAIPAGGMPVNGANLLSVGLTGGTLSRAILEYRTTGDLAVKLVDKANVVVANTVTNFNLDGDRFFAWLTLTQSGADIIGQVAVMEIVTGDFSPAVAVGGAAALGQTLGRAQSVTAGVEGDANGPLSLTVPVTIGHIVVSSSKFSPFRSDTLHYYPALVGHFSEGAHERIVRLCREEGIDVLGYFDQPPMAGPYHVESTPLGPQRAGALLDLLQEAADADGGILYEPRGFTGLAYRARAAQENRAADLTLSYTSGHVVAPFEPVDDDQATRNDITVTRIGGASARAELTSGPLSVLPPPAGVGRYDEAVDLSLWKDSQAADVAGWRLHLGTWDEARYPQVSVKLHKSTALIGSAAGADCGDRLDITNLPAFLPPGPAGALVQGYSEELDGVEWSVTYNCSPAGPYRVATLDSDDFGRLDSDSSFLAADATSGAIVLYVETLEPAPLWITTATHPTEFPFDVALGGEVVTVTGASHGIGDFFTRSVTDGWGNASTTGHAWALAGGNGPDFDVNGSAGTFTNTQAVNVEGIQEAAATWEDIDQTVTITFQTLPTGANIVASIWARRGTSSRVKARLFHVTSDNLNVDILGNNAATILGSASTVLTGMTGVPFNARLQVRGTTVRLKVWRGAEPTRWTLEVTDTAAPAAGGVALSGLRQTGNTNVNPVMEFDNYAVTNPQRFVVTRATNGIVKAHSAGTQIQLADPVYAPQGGDA